MKLATWSPSYNIVDLYLKQGEDKPIKVVVGKDKLGEYEGPNIGIVVMGQVESFLQDFSTIGPITDNTVRLLDTLDEYGINNVNFVKYANLKKGKALIGELKEFEAEANVYETQCVNPLVDTEIAKQLENLKLLFVAGVQSSLNLQQLVNHLLAMKQAGKLGIEKIALVESCCGLTKEISHAKEVDTWAKYSLQQQGALIAKIYKGDTIIS